MTLDDIRNHWLRSPMAEDNRRYQYTAPMPTPRFLAVASVVLLPPGVSVCGGFRGEWRACVDTVPGHNHDNEWFEVARFGGKLSEAQARLFFPNMPAELRYAE